MKKIFAITLTGLTLLMAGSLSQADQVTTDLNVTATVTNSCLVEATTLAFGNYDPTSATDNDNTATITVTCTTGTNFEVGLGTGTATGATVSTRQMTGVTNSELLNYAVYTDSGRTLNWDDIGGNTNSGTADLATPSQYTVYGRIPQGQNVSADDYSDTVVVTVDFI